MSMFFFRLHNLRREEENKKRRQRDSRQRRTIGRSIGCPTMRFPNNLTLAPSRLFERTPLTPSDSLDEVALQIPRYASSGIRLASPSLAVPASADFYRVLFFPKKFQKEGK